MSLLSTIQRAAVLAGVSKPVVAAAATDGITALMVELARLEAEALSGRHDWSETIRTKSFTTISAQGQPSALPDDFQRFTFAGGLYGPWGRINGPVQRADWSRLTSFPTVTGSLNGSFRIYRGGLEVYPAPAADLTIRYDYVTKNIYADKDGDEKCCWNADSDTCSIPEQLIALGIVWRFRKAKGLDDGEDMKNAEDEFSKLSGADAGGRDIVKVGRSRLRADTYAFPGIIEVP